MPRSKRKWKRYKWNIETCAEMIHFYDFAYLFFHTYPIVIKLALLETILNKLLRKKESERWIRKL